MSPRESACSRLSSLTLGASKAVGAMERKHEPGPRLAGPTDWSDSSRRVVAVEEVTVIEEVVADKGYHKAEMLAECVALGGLRTYIPKSERAKLRVWTDKPAAWQNAYRNNR